MKVTLFGCWFTAALCGTAAFMTPCSKRSVALSTRTLAQRQSPSASWYISSRVRPATTGLVCVARSSLKMSGDVEADGGARDGAVLAEARIVVHGQATGGYFRAHARNEAHFNRKLCGALKELGEGQTEIIVEGKTSAIRSFLRWCKRGPGLSQRIQDVTVDWAEYTGIFDGFEVTISSLHERPSAEVIHDSGTYWCSPAISIGAGAPLSLKHNCDRIVHKEVFPGEKLPNHNAAGVP